MTYVFRAGGAVLTKEELAAKLLTLAEDIRQEDRKTFEWLRSRAKELLE